MIMAELQKIAFFDTKPYDRRSFDRVNTDFGFDITHFEDLSTDMIDDDVLARLLTFPNVLITSHQGFFTAEALHNIAQTTLQNVQAFAGGQTLTNEICYQIPAGMAPEGQK